MDSLVKSLATVFVDIMKCFAHQGMESKDFLLLVFLLVSIIGASRSLRCFSCTTEGSRCTYTIGCHGECYKATAERKIKDVNNKLGRDAVVTEVGCIGNCSIEEQRSKACHADPNCNIICCSNDYCNRLLSNDTGDKSQSYPNCHSCSSTESYEDCGASSSLSTCSYTTGTAYCYKMDYESRYGSKKRIYKKGCVTSYAGCDSLRSAYCGAGKYTDCNVFCCSGNACNAGSETVVSVLAILSCVVVAMLSYIMV